MGSIHLLFLCALCLIFSPCSRGTRSQRPNRRIDNPIDRIQAQNNFNVQQFTGVWHLISVGSMCGYLKLNNHRLEAVTMKVTNQNQDIRINTLRKLDGLCWDIKQDYKMDATPGRFSRKNRGIKTDIVIAETDYSNYAILFLQQRRKITVKLYGEYSVVQT
ncbi:complement component C8 gamma chain [Chiloscyllium plagiosum]|uniref:complement component C8 gamma chain n=1 Tax=Chiloscyllium plagiosum TaxID=36176 RepID=UPI001CB7FD48|nr:complement component C8 gamma chain [Chiloscyllium plagiosum]